ncbi:MAG: hypothetical protein PWR20_702 [Bacteroidales bacterium]|jgi:hypothetical protein|nr:hypothetical protein [Bacteroidales bacterium]MDN5329150.1 hypothetical protein [Bacteroidales bacterium]
MLKSRNFWIWLVVIVLAAVALWLLSSRSGSTFASHERDFGVNDTASITRIFLADKREHKVVLQRQPEGYWMVNGRYKVSKPIIDMFLHTVAAIEVKEPVPIAQQPKIVSLLAANAKKVEIYQNLPRIKLFGRAWGYREKLSKTYYVGDATPDLTGTYMIMEGASTPFIVEMPGLRGFVAPRYSVIEADWRDHTIFNYRLQNIREVTLEFPEFPQESYKVINKGSQGLELIQLVSNQPVHRFDTLRLLAFMNSFNNIKFESLLNDVKELNIDSIRQQQPFHVLTVSLADGKQIRIKTFHKKSETEFYGDDGKLIPWDPDRMYAEINEGKDFVLVQFFTFDKITRPLSWFLKPEQGRKPGKQ